MTNAEYGSAQANMVASIEKFLDNKCLKDFIPDEIRKSLELVIAFYKESKDHIFADGKIVQLSIWNLRRWWKFIKLARNFVNDLVNVWK